MRNIKYQLLVAALVSLIFGATAKAQVVRTTSSFGYGENAFDIDFVTIGDAGNEHDEFVYYSAAGNGGVDHEYRIGTYEVTNGQWNAFVAMAGAPTGLPTEAYDNGSFSGGPNRPTNKVSWYEAAQFCNWLNTSKGYEAAYLFDANGAFQMQPGDAGYRNPNAAYFLPSHDEWYKAAYYSLAESTPGTNDVYYDYANGTNTKPANNTSGANYYDGGYGYTDPENTALHIWDVGTGAMDQNGTWDMSGNLAEMIESARYWPDDDPAKERASRGGDYSHGDIDLSVYFPGHFYPQDEHGIVGFRIASIVNPVDPIAGDANADNVVDSVDAAILAEHWLMSDATWADGDFNYDGVVNDQDATLMASNWSPSQTAVPEPSCFVLLGILGLALLAIRRK